MEILKIGSDFAALLGMFAAGYLMLLLA